VRTSCISSWWQNVNGSKRSFFPTVSGWQWLDMCKHIRLLYGFFVMYVCVCKHKQIRIRTRTRARHAYTQNSQKGSRRARAASSCQLEPFSRATRIHTKLTEGLKLLVGLLTYRRSQSNETDTLRQHVDWAQAHCQVNDSFFEPSLSVGGQPSILLTHQAHQTTKTEHRSANT